MMLLNKIWKLMMMMKRSMNQSPLVTMSNGVVLVKVFLSLINHGVLFPCAGSIVLIW